MNKSVVRVHWSIKTLLILLILTAGYSAVFAQQKEMDKGMMVRISEIEIVPEFLEEYKTILKKESAASVKLEKGVVAIFPMFQKENPTAVRILEIYASREAYEAHLKTPHFQEYKRATLKMVKSLKLVDMDALDAETMTEIFKKIKKGKNEFGKQAIYNGRTKTDKRRG